VAFDESRSRSMWLLRGLGVLAWVALSLLLGGSPAHAEDGQERPVQSASQEVPAAVEQVAQTRPQAQMHTAAPPRAQAPAPQKSPRTEAGPPSAPAAPPEVPQSTSPPAAQRNAAQEPAAKPLAPVTAGPSSAGPSSAHAGGTASARPAEASHGPARAAVAQAQHGPSSAAHGPSSAAHGQSPATPGHPAATAGDHPVVAAPGGRPAAVPPAVSGAMADAHEDDDPAASPTVLLADDGLAVAACAPLPPFSVGGAVRAHVAPTLARTAPGAEPIAGDAPASGPTDPALPPAAPWQGDAPHPPAAPPSTSTPASGPSPIQGDVPGGIGAADPTGLIMIGPRAGDDLLPAGPAGAADVSPD